jgi:hypothetical protein
MSMEVSLALLSASITLTAEICKFVPRRINTPNVQADIAAINATLSHIQGDIKEIKRELFFQRNKG